jgi:hypothetical protein
MTITRRTLIKGAAVTGGLAWTAPVIESFTAKAAAASVAHSCCACFAATGTFIGAAADDFTDAGCEILCSRAATGVIAGTFLRFSAPNSFVAAGITEVNPGCTYAGVYLDGLAGTGPTTCPPITELPGGVACDHGVWTAT